jgi:HK97 family phage major capsid protein
MSRVFFLWRTPAEEEAMLIGVALAGLVLVAVWLGVAHVIDGAEGMTSDQLYAVGVERTQAALAVREAAKAANRSETDEELAQIDALLADAETARDTGDKFAAREQRETRLAAATAALTAPRPRVTQTAGNVVSKGTQPADRALTSGLRDRAQDDGQRGFKSYDEYLRGVRAVSVPGGSYDERLRPLAAAAGNSGLSGADGAFLIPPAWSDQVYERAITSIPILADCDRITLTGPGNTVNVAAYVDHDRSSTTYRHAGVVVYRVQEGDDLTISKLQIARREIRIHDVGALSVVTGDLLNDTTNFASRIMAKQAEAIAEFMTEDVMWGTGAGQPLGAWADENDAVIEQDAEVGQIADSIDHQNILKMMDRLDPASESTAKFYYNRQLRSKLRSMTIPVGTGGQVSVLFERGAAGRPDSLDGLVAYSTDHCEKPGDVGDIVLGSMRQYALVTKGTAETAMSQHVYFVSNQNAYRTIVRYGGMPMWDRAMTPRKGATGITQGPWVKLAAR